MSTATAPAGVYRPRRPEGSPLYRLSEGDFERFVRVYDERFEHLLAFRCQTRNFCPSCQAKRAALFGERLIEEILEDVPHRHVTFTVPKVLRGLFERERKLLKILPRSAHRAVEIMLREAVGSRRVRVGTIASIQTFGSFAANFHPHVHALVTEGVFHPLGAKALYFERSSGGTSVLCRTCSASWSSES